MLGHCIFFIILLQSWSVFAFPAKISVLSYSAKKYNKKIFLIGDIHSYKEYETHKESLDLMDDFFADILTKNRRLTLIWEIEKIYRPYDKTSYYMRNKIHQIYRNFSDPRYLKIIAADKKRHSSKILKKFLLELVFAPQKAKKRMQNLKFRTHLLSILPKLGVKIIFNKVPVKIKKNIFAANEVFVSELKFLCKAVKHWDKLPLRQDELLHELKKKLVCELCDNEILAKIFIDKNKNILVYAGKGHIDRIEKFLISLGFKLYFSKKTPLKKLDFYNFRVAFKD